ncbi:MAG: ELWxxDGT repeat protein [Thermoanaerobaculia bacterium]
MTRLRGLAPLLVTALLGTALQAQPAFLVKDIGPGFASPSWPHETEWVALGGLAVFTRPDTVHGIEIWKSDGTAAGTSPILDICPGVCSSSPGSLAVVGSVVFFHADDGVHGPSLWKTDGTAAGTILVREVFPFHTIALGSVLLFQHFSPAGSLELWRSDGTREGTSPLWHFGPDADGSDPWLGYAGGLLLFAAEDPVHGQGLWKTDGTAAGTSFLLSMGSLYGPPATGELYPSIGGRLFFRAGDGKLWVSDGTPAGTYKIADVNAFSSGCEPDFRIVALRNEVFFGGSESQGGLELWKSDGTLAGTVRVKDINPGVASSYPCEITALGDHLFFRTLQSPRLWKTDGTEAGTVPVAPGLALDFKEIYNGFQVLGGKLVFFASANGTGYEPWVTDGSAAGTLLLADIHPGAPSSFDNGGWYGADGYPLSQLDGGAIAGGQWIFRAQTPGGWAVWKSDGTPARTGLVHSLVDGTGGSGLSPFFNPAAPGLADLDGTLIFTGDDDGRPANLWRSDGSAPGTSRIDGIPYTPADLTRLGDHVYFSSPDSGRLWRTDGVTAEIVEGDSGGIGRYWVSNLTAAGPNLFYIASSMNGYDGRIQRTDGTTIAQILISPSTWGLGDLTAAGTNLFFSEPIWGAKVLWKSAGAPNDAVEIGTFPNAWPRQLESLAGFGNSVFFAANQGSAGRELWFSDGTVAGTRMVKDIVSGAGSSDPRSIVAAGNLAFFIADDGIAGAELWRSDGTEAGTFRARDIRPGSETSWIRGLTAHGNFVLFAADDGVNGVELWSSDGTEAGTVLVIDIRPGAGSSFPGAFRVAGPFLLFAADDGTHGLEPWRTDGTAPGTFLIQDIHPGPEPSSPAGFTLSGDRVFFTATDKIHGFELWAVDLAALGPAVISYLPLDFHTVAPCRVLDTRGSAPLAPDVPRNIPVAGTCGIPTTAKAVAANLTVFGSTGAGYLTAYPAGIPVPATVNLTFSAGQVRSNSLQLGLLGGQADAQASVAVHLIVDVSGYYE